MCLDVGGSRRRADQVPGRLPRLGDVTDSGGDGQGGRTWTALAATVEVVAAAAEAAVVAVVPASVEVAAGAAGALDASAIYEKTVVLSRLASPR